MTDLQEKYYNEIGMMRKGTKRQIARLLSLLSVAIVIAWWYGLLNLEMRIFQYDDRHAIRGADTADYMVEENLPRNVAANLKEMCGRSNLNTTTRWNEASKHNFFHFFLVFDKFKTIYCYVPKAGSTAWKSVIANASGFRREDFRHLEQRERPEVWIHDAIYEKYPRLGEFSVKEINYRLENYFKFTVVRNPLDRLLSTYMDKFYRVDFEGSPATPPYTHYSHKIRRYSAVRNHRPLSRKNKITFKDFISYVANFGPPRNEHWETYDNICHPCGVDFSFIGTVESMERDKYQILKGMNLTRAQLPVEHSTKHKLFLDYYKDIDEADLRKLIKTYNLDFSLFGYAPDIL